MDNAKPFCISKREVCPAQATGVKSLLMTFIEPSFVQCQK